MAFTFGNIFAQSLMDAYRLRAQQNMQLERLLTQKQIAYEHDQTLKDTNAATNKTRRDIAALGRDLQDKLFHERLNWDKQVWNTKRQDFLKQQQQLTNATKGIINLITNPNMNTQIYPQDSEPMQQGSFAFYKALLRKKDVTPLHLYSNIVGWVMSQIDPAGVSNKIAKGATQNSLAQQQQFIRNQAMQTTNPTMLKFLVPLLLRNMNTYNSMYGSYMAPQGTITFNPLLGIGGQ